MKHKELIRQSKTQLQKHPGYMPRPHFSKLFSAGAQWMFHKLHELDNRNYIQFDAAINYNLYGCIKYGICLLAFCASAMWLIDYSFFLLPLSILIFYLFEVHLLFLFPLLIDQQPAPIRTSIQLIYKIGVLKAMTTVIPIGFFMIWGLFRIRDPFRNWYIGSLSILIWYKYEIRNRL